MFNNKYATLECCTTFKKKKRGFVALGGGVEGVGAVAGNPFLRFQVEFVILFSDVEI
jgi:hypothetical protein